MIDVSPARLVIAYLKGGVSPVITGDWLAYTPTEPSEGSRTVTVRNTGGIVQGTSQQTGLPNVKPSVQIRVRGETDEVARSKLVAIANVLSAVKYPTPVTVDGVTYNLWSFVRTIEPTFLTVTGQQQRYVWVMSGILSFTGA